jgi:hypothetical protein
MLFAGGAVAFEELTGTKWKSLKSIYAVSIVALGALLAPMSAPVLQELELGVTKARISHALNEFSGLNSLNSLNSWLPVRCYRQTKENLCLES